MSDLFPPWVILHLPHDSTLVPPEVRHQIILGDDDLARELIKMTDHLTLSLFASGVPEAQVIRAPVSRLVWTSSGSKTTSKSPWRAGAWARSTA